MSKKLAYIPVRIQGKLGVVESNDEGINGKHVATLFVSTMDQKNKVELGTIGPYKNEQEAKQNLKEKAMILSDALTKIFVGDNVEPTGIINMKTGKHQSWDEPLSDNP